MLHAFLCMKRKPTTNSSHIHKQTRKKKKKMNYSLVILFTAEDQEATC